MSLELWIAFVFASSVLLIIPGPTILTVVSYALKHGPTATTRLVLAVALGDAVAATISLLGLGTLLATSAFLFELVKIIGGIYLVYLGLRFLSSKPLIDQPLSEAPKIVTNHNTFNTIKKRDAVFANTFLVTALNPKGIVFFAAFLPQFIDPRLSMPPQLITLTTTFVALGAANATLYAYLANRANKILKVQGFRQRLHLASGSLMTIAGVWTLTSEKI